MKYLVLEDDRAKICTSKTLRAWINHTHGGIRVYRLCGLNDPVELFIQSFDLIVDRYGNIEEGLK